MGTYIMCISQTVFEDCLNSIYNLDYEFLCISFTCKIISEILHALYGVHFWSINKLILQPSLKTILLQLIKNLFVIIKWLFGYLNGNVKSQVTTQDKNMALNTRINSIGNHKELQSNFAKLESMTTRYSRNNPYMNISYIFHTADLRTIMKIINVVTKS